MVFLVMRCGHKLTRRGQEHDGSLTRAPAGDAVGPLGALEAVAYSSIKLSRYVSECEMSMDLLVVEAVLEFGEALRNLREAAGEWTDEVLS
jgi:hypothetical protein